MTKVAKSNKKERKVKRKQKQQKAPTPEPNESDIDNSEIVDFIESQQVSEDEATVTQTEIQEPSTEKQEPSVDQLENLLKSGELDSSDEEAVRQYIAEQRNLPEPTLDELKELLASGELGTDDENELREIIEFEESAANDSEPTLKELEILLESGDLTDKQEMELKEHIEMLKAQETGSAAEEEVEIGSNDGILSVPSKEDLEEMLAAETKMSEEQKQNLRDMFTGMEGYDNKDSDQDSDDSQGLEISREELDAILSRKDLTFEEKESIRKEFENSVEGDDEFPTVQELEELLENGDLNDEERGQLEDMLTELVMAQNDDSDNYASDGSNSSEEYSKADLQQILDTEDLTDQEREALDLFIGNIQDEESESELGPKIVELNSENEEIKEDVDESDNCVGIDDVNALMESQDLDEAEKLQLKNFIDRREEESQDSSTEFEDSDGQENQDLDINQARLLLESGELDIEEQEAVKAYIKDLETLDGSEQDSGEESAGEFLDLDQVRELLESGELNAEEEEELKSILKELENEPKDFEDDEQSDVGSDAEVNVESLKEILKSEDLNSEERAALEEYLQELESGKQESDEESVDIEDMKKLLASGELEAEEEARVRAFLEEKESTSDSEDVDIDQMKELLVSGELDQEEEAEIKDYINRHESKNESKMPSIEEIEEALEQSDLESEEEKELRAYLEMKKASSKQSNHKRRADKAFANKKDEMLEKYHEIRLDQPGLALPWIETMSVTSKKASPFLSDQSLAADDLKRELEFYKQALEAARIGRKECKKANVPFSRPNDYLAEMIKSDAHMQRVRQNLVDEAAAIKASQEAKALRAQKKFGKKVQVEKLRERQATKKAELDKVKVGKKKTGGGNSISLEKEDVIVGGKRLREDDFDVGVENENAVKKPRRDGKSGKRAGKDSKFGFGGKKRNIKSNTAESTDDFGRKSKSFEKRTGGGKKAAGGKPKRMGKAKRQANRK